MTSRSLIRVSTLLTGALILAACGPRSQPGQASQTSPDAGAIRPPKTITIAIQRELAGFATFLSGTASTNTGGGGNPQYIAHDTLVVENERGVYEPRLAS